MPHTVSRVTTLLALALVLGAVAMSGIARAQKVDDGSESAIGKVNAEIVLDLIRKNLKEHDGAKVTVLRKTEGAWICGSVNVKNQDGLYTGERGFVVDLADLFFGRVPDGPEMLSPRSAGFPEKERIRQLYFRMCLD